MSETTNHIGQSTEAIARWILLKSTIVVTLLLAGVAASSMAQAGTILLAHTTIPGTETDLSGLSAPLENGVPDNLLAVFGSGLAFAGGNTFLALPDRGPNAVSYNPLVDDTASYIEPALWERGHREARTTAWEAVCLP